jgi:hypothetical protein
LSPHPERLQLARFDDLIDVSAASRAVRQIRRAIWSNTRVGHFVARAATLTQVAIAPTTTVPVLGASGAIAA